MRAVLVFCEGNHDIVFVTRSLGAIANGEWVGSPIGELPSPLGPVLDPANPNRPKVRSLIAQRYSARTLDDLHLEAAAHAPPPSFKAIVKVTGTRIDTLFTLIRCQGDGAASSAISLLQEFKSLLLPGLQMDITEVAAAFLFDADNLGIAGRETKFASDHATILQGSNQPQHGGWVQGRDYPVGLYVFHDPATRTGTLEDVLAPMVETQWKPRWDDAGSYLSNHASNNDPVARNAAERLKAQINIVGQFRCPGDPMTQIIRKKRGLPPTHFKGSASQSLVDFLINIPWK